MLLLAREKDEQILIGNDIVITVCRTGRRTVIGVSAPRYLAVDRPEIRRAKLLGLPGPARTRKGDPV